MQVIVWHLSPLQLLDDDFFVILTAFTVPVGDPKIITIALNIAVDRTSTAMIEFMMLLFNFKMMIYFL
jgi:hypothetical protein